MTAFGAMAQDYVDYCAMYGASDKDKPLSFSDYFDNATFWHGGGDWFTYETLHKHMGDDEDDITVEKYMKARQTSRTGNLKERNDIIAKKIQEIEAAFKKDKHFHPDMNDPDYGSLNPAVFEAIRDNLENPYPQQSIVDKAKKPEKSLNKDKMTKLTDKQKQAAKPGAAAFKKSIGKK